MRRLTPARSAVVAAGLAGVALVRWPRVVVSGLSMLPTLEPGDRLVVVPWRRPRPGDLVALRDPRDPTRTIVKRVAARPGETAAVPGGGLLPAGAGYVVLGDNPGASTDSRDFGPVPPSALRGTVAYRYHPPERAGRL